MDSQVIAALLVRCQAGDATAWDALVEAYWQRLYGYAVRATSNNELARDLVQETFLRIVQRLDGYSDQGKFEAWLFRILVNLVRDHGRRVARHPTRSTVIHDGENGTDLADEMPGKHVCPSQPVQHEEEVERLQHALARLPELDRQVLMLRHYADMPFKEIAKTLNCPIGTVLARAHRALGKMRSFMEVTNETP
ncbi:MAG: sigma-70 family RNA polymerase sigma factor [Phycisphaerales bacterium]|nr:sigma-70 family RNA polymerase sigma factor [Phycisphaerales bacterium]